MRDARQMQVGKALIAVGQINHQRPVTTCHQLAHQFTAQKAVAADQDMFHGRFQLCDRMTVPARMVPMPITRVRFMLSPHMKKPHAATMM